MKARRVMAYLGGLLGLLLLVSGLSIEIVRGRLGNRVIGCYSGVEYSLCVLDRDATAEIIVAGDSRALVQINPLLLDSLTGRRAINIAQQANLGGDILTLVNSLRKYPGILAGKPTLLISISALSLNDYSLDWISMNTLFNWTAWEHLQMAIRKPVYYLRFLRTRYLPTLYRELGHQWKGEQFLCDDDVYRPQALVDSRGYAPSSPSKQANKTYRQRGKREEYRIDGANWRLFQKAMEWLCQTPIEKIILVNAPFNPVWLERFAPPGFMDMQRKYSEQLTTLTEQEAKIQFVDFLSEPLRLPLDSSRFTDGFHLNELGAEAFSRYLGEYLLGNRTHGHSMLGARL